MIARWFRFHFVTCLAMTVATVALVVPNLRCPIFFGPSGTTVLKFGHGWPVHFQEGAVPGPGQRRPNPNGIIPNYIWGHPEFNDMPEIMARHNAEIEGMPRTPWGLHVLAEPSIFGIVVDLVVALAVLIPLSFLCEMTICAAGRQADSFYPVVSFVVLLAMGTIVTSVFIPAAWHYVVPVFFVVVVSIIVTGLARACGYR